MDANPARAREVCGPTSKAQVLKQWGPFSNAEAVHGVTFDGCSIWWARGDALVAIHPESGVVERTLDLPANAGTTFDGRYLYQIAAGHIQKVDPRSGEVLSTLPSPAGSNSAGLTWADGKLWVANYPEKTILQVDPRTGEVLKKLSSTKFVTGVTFVQGELWHGTRGDDQSEIRRISPHTGEVIHSIALPPGTHVSGLESNGEDILYLGGGSSKTVTAIFRPKTD